LKLKWPIFIGLLLLTVGLFFLAPNLTEQAEEAGVIQLADDASSQRAADMKADAGAAAQTISLVVPLEEELNEDKRAELTQLAQDVEALGEPVTEVLNPFENEELEEQLISE